MGGEAYGTVPGEGQTRRHEPEADQGDLEVASWVLFLSPDDEGLEEDHGDEHDVEGQDGFPACAGGGRGGWNNALLRRGGGVDDRVEVAVRDRIGNNLEIST